jgi:hypothetical protein
VVWQPNNAQWWVLVLVALLLVAVWPPSNDRSLALKFVNWAVDPRDSLPTMPSDLDMDQGDDADAVQAHDTQEQHYFIEYDKGGLTRLRLQLKVATDPFNPGTERQLLAALGVFAGLVVWKMSGRGETGKGA